MSRVDAGASRGQLLGLSGTFASGKDTVANYLAKEHSFTHVSTGDMIRHEAKKRGQEKSRDILVAIGNELREIHGPGVLVERALEHFGGSKRLAISGIRAVGEAEALKKAGGKLIFLDAPIEQRYQRLRQRGRIGDETTLEQFQRDEERELSSVQNTHQNINAVRRLADFELLNDRSEAELFTAVRGLLAQL